MKNNKACTYDQISLPVCIQKSRMFSDYANSNINLNSYENKCSNNTIENVIHLNLVKKNPQISYYNKKLNADIIGVSGTWLRQSTPNRTIDILGYKIFRSDRNFHKMNIVKGGGCM